MIKSLQEQSLQMAKEKQEIYGKLITASTFTLQVTVASAGLLLR